MVPALFVMPALKVTLPTCVSQITAGGSTVACAAPLKIETPLLSLSMKCIDVGVSLYSAPTVMVPFVPLQFTETVVKLPSIDVPPPTKVPPVTDQLYQFG